MDPFVSFEYEGAKFRTKTHENGGKNPHWHETFEIITKDLNHDIHFLVFDSKLLKNEEVNKSLTLIARKRNNQTSFALQQHGSSGMGQNHERARACGGTSDRN